MRPFRGVAILGLAVAALHAQQITPHVGYVYPAGGRQGTSFEVTVGGQFLDGVANAYVSGSGVQVSVVKHTKLLTQGQINRLREQLQELTEKRNAALKQQRKRGADEAEPAAKPAWTPEDERTVADIREKMANFIRRPASAAIAEQVLLKVTVAPDAAPGERELRLAAGLGLTNPLLFCVGQLPEISKPPSKVTPEPGTEVRPRFRTQAPPPGPQTPPTIAIPAVVNGQIGPGGVDRYRFQATRGQKLVVAAAARELIPYISDAVPGWFQATLALYDSKGKEVNYADHYRFHPDPVLYYDIASDGEYTLEIKDSIYRGREDFVYRITIGELPFVTGIFPLGGKAGASTPVELKGWNLPASRITQDGRGKGPGIVPVSVRKGDLTSNRLPFAVDALPETFEKEANNEIKRAQKVKLPLIVNGRIDQPGDWDVFRIDGRAGEEVVAEVFARRLDSPLDSILKLTDSNGRELAVNDDYEDKGAGLLTHQADSRLIAKLPKNGTYYIHIGDTQRKGGPEYAYRLRISRPQPDFELRVSPASINARGGATIPITVYALRRDGFSGDIALKLKDAPPGFTLSGAVVPGNQDKVRLTLTVPSSRIEQPRNISLEGRASIQGHDVRRIGAPVEDMMQAFAYRHLVPAKEWLVRVMGSGRARMPVWRVAAEKQVKVPAGGSTPVRVAVPLGQYAGQIRLALNEPPEGMAIQNVSPTKDGLSFVLHTEAGKIKPGLRGNLIVEAFLETRSAQGNSKKAALRRQPIGTLPAIPFEVVNE